jgi:hypothetical protein
MKAHGWLRLAIKRTSGSAASVPEASSAGAVRAWAASGILALALVPGGMGVAAAVSPGHAGASHVHARHVHAGARQRTGGHAASASAAAMNTGSTGGAVRRPWIY